MLPRSSAAGAKLDSPKPRRHYASCTSSCRGAGDSAWRSAADGQGGAGLPHHIQSAKGGAAPQGFEPAPFHIVSACAAVLLQAAW